MLVVQVTETEVGIVTETDHTGAAGVPAVVAVRRGHDHVANHTVPGHVDPAAVAAADARGHIALVLETAGRIAHVQEIRSVMGSHPGVAETVNSGQ